MFVSSRIKNASTASLNTSQILNSSFDDSRVDSISSKRFARKKVSGNESNRSGKTPKANDQKIKLQSNQTKVSTETKKTNLVGNGFIREEDLFLKISHTPSKNALYIPPISSDRATETTIFNKHEQFLNGGQLFDIPTTKKKNTVDIEEELQLRQAEVMLLEDENMRLKRDIASRQSEYFKLRTLQEKQHQNILQKLNLQIDTLKTELATKNEEIKIFRKTEATLTRDLKGAKYEKAVLQKQLQQIYKKRLPKQLKDLMSFREVSLMRQVEQLREELQKQKSQKQKVMEFQIGALKKNNNQKNNCLKKLQIHSHVLSKKIIDTEEQLKLQTQQFSKLFINIKQSNTSLADQLKKSRKENVKLRRLNMLTLQHKRKGSLGSEESDTLSISISPRSDREK